MAETHSTFCRICESLCGLEVTVEGGDIVKIAPDRAHVATRGFACIKGVKQQKMYTSPDRVTHPMKRVGERFVAATWEEALADIGSRVRRLLDEDGPDSIGCYVGTAAGFSFLHPIFVQGFMDGLGSRQVYASATQDCASKFAAAREMYGFPLTQPFPDLPHTECLVVVGANPVVSKWSFLQVPNPFQHLKELEKRGCRIVWVDPRRTESVKAAGEHHFIKPSTDVWFYLAFLHEVFARGALADSHLAHASGVETLRELVAPWTPERCAEVTQLPADALRDIVSAYLQADGAALYCSTGVNMGRHGALCWWLQESISLLTGNLDRRGGTLVGEGVFDFASFGHKHGVMTRRDPSRVGGFETNNDAWPGGILADEIRTPGRGQLKAMFVTGGNPLLTMADSARLREAMGELELLVCVDIYINETGQLADWVLPATSPLQRPDLPFAFPSWLGMQTRPYLQATRAVVPPAGEQRDEPTIFHDLARACGVNLFGSRAAGLALGGLRRFHKLRTGEDAIPQEGLMDLFLRVTGQGSFRTLLAEPHGRLRGENAPGRLLGKRVFTPSGKVELAPPRYVEHARALDADWEQERERSGLRLITKRELTTHNSWTHNLADFVPQRNRTNHLYMHPADAEVLGLGDGVLVDVSTDVATVRLPLSLDEDLMRGVVALPHGWGHQHARHLSVASQTEGVNVNLLAAAGPDNVCRLSGMSQLTGLEVTVAAAAGPRAQTWSGIAS